MPIRVPSHLYRNRHGTFYFRLAIPEDLRACLRRTEVRLSLGTEVRQAAIIASLHLIAALPSLTAELRRMADNDESAAPDFFKLWRVQVLKNGLLSAQISILRDELQDREYQIADMVPRAKAETVVKHAYLFSNNAAFWTQAKGWLFTLNSWATGGVKV